MIARLATGRLRQCGSLTRQIAEANIRTGITPSLIARYTTGHSLGVKAFYRVQLAPLWSAISLNVWSRWPARTTRT